jgi:microcystin-dependent protein
MAYTKTTWAHDTKISTTNMNNAETQYDLAYADAVAHNHDTRYYTKTEMDNWFWWSGNDGPGSGMDADMLYYPGTNKHYADFGAGGVAQYTIIMWEGVSLPSGWVECNGSGGTPDLRDTFVVGAGGSYSVGASGGYNAWTQDYAVTVAAHTITEAELPSHTHSFTDNSSPTDTGGGGGDNYSTMSVMTSSSGTTASAGSGGSHGHTGSTSTLNWTENKPPCVSLKYIMKS